MIELKTPERILKKTENDLAEAQRLKQEYFDAKKKLQDLEEGKDPSPFTPTGEAETQRLKEGAKIFSILSSR